MENIQIEVTKPLPPVSSSTATINDLHHYALLPICRALDKFSDQLAFAQSYMNACDIFVNYVWKNQANLLQVGVVDMAVCQKTRQQHFFLAKHMREHVTTFTCVPRKDSFPMGLEGYLRQLSAMGIEQFPHVTLCVIQSSEYISDELMLKLTKLMPNLKTLKLTKQRLSGRNISNFVQLEQLYLEHVYIQPQIMDRIFKGLSRLHTLDIHNNRNFRLNGIQAPGLRVLRLNANTAEGMMPTILALPHLKELEVRYCRDTHPFGAAPEHHDGWPQLASTGGARNMLPHVLVTKAAQITSIAVNNSAVNLPADWTDRLPQFQLPKLESLVFAHWQHQDLFLKGHLEQSNLSLLSLGNWTHATPQSLASLVTKFNELKLLELVHNEIEFHEALQGMADVLKHCERTQPLLVWSWTNAIRLLKATEKAYWKENKHVQLDDGQKRHMYMRDMFGFNVKFDNSPNA